VNDLPERPSYGPPPPSAGALGAISTARHRRRRNRALTGGGLAAAVVAVAAAAVLGGGTHALSEDRLEQVATPSPEASASTAPSPSSPAASSAPSGSTGGEPAASGEPGSGPASPAPSSPGGSGATAAPQPTQQPGYRTPDMTRTYGPARTAPAGAAVCGTTTFDDDGQGRTSGWCFTTEVGEPTPSGRRLLLRICRDDTGPGSLTYGDGLETDLAVLSGQREVWRWSADRSFPEQEHALPAERRYCYTWSVDWTQVDGSGRRLPAGDYTLLATSRAHEVAGTPSHKESFRIG
jgi:hypothetical protein